MSVAFILANSDHGSLIVNRFDYNRSFNDEYYGVGAQILETGSYDAQEIEQLKALLPLRKQYFGSGVVVLDCGANIGIHTLEFAKTIRGYGNIIAIEAQERLFYALAGNIALHNAFNAKALWAAVSDTDGELQIPEPDYTAPGSYGSFELKPRIGVENIGQPIDYDKPTLTVTTVTIDSFNLPRLDFLKLDIEGMELEALAGAAETIKRCKPIMHIEAIKVDRAELDKVLAGHGYNSFPSGMNVLAIHKDDPSASHVSVEKRRAA